jgi:DNA alkylation damage repair protein AlkB
MAVHAHTICESAIHLSGFLGLAEQADLVRTCFLLGRQDAGFYRPVLRNGATMQLRMLCLGKHWNAKRYTYQSRREDVDGKLVQPLPVELINLAGRIATAAGMMLSPDIALVNLYDGDGRLGLHQDKDERPETLAKGTPVVSISLGDDAEFLFGSQLRRDAVQSILLKSGDAFVFGGGSRMCYHGVRRILSNTGPDELNFKGRLNITFREY